MAQDSGQRKNRLRKITPFVFALALIAALAGIVFYARHAAVLHPAGLIGEKQRNLLIFGCLLSVIIVVPVFIMTFVIVWKYRDGRKAKYSPEWDHSHFYETLWWGIPCLIIVVLGIVAWKSSRDLDPFRAIDSNKKPLTIQVVALQWKWLFIYPEQHIATVNYAQFPEKTPIDFEITADAPMNSFWIPKLGGQIYAMSGMSTHLHLMADKASSYNGVSANISGKGFAGMKFMAVASSNQKFDDWIATVKQKNNILTDDVYNQLAQPSENHPIAYYSSARPGLYDTILMKYMGSHSETLQTAGAQ